VAAAARHQGQDISVLTGSWLFAAGAEVLLARVRDRKQRIGSRLSVESILGHRDADRR
jgi:hypothetical protein